MPIGNASNHDRTGKRIAPPRDMSPEARKVFIGVTEAFAPSYFGVADAPQLATYCEAVARLTVLNRQLAKEGPTVPTANGSTQPNPLLHVINRVERTVATLATKCRLAKSTRERFETSAQAAKQAIAPPPPWLYDLSDPAKMAEWWSAEKVFRRSLPKPEARGRARLYGALPRGS